MHQQLVGDTAVKGGAGGARMSEKFEDDDDPDILDSNL